MTALLFVQRTLKGRSGPTAGGIEEQQHRDGAMANFLRTRSSVVGSINVDKYYTGVW